MSKNGFYLLKRDKNITYKPKTNIFGEAIVNTTEYDYYIKSKLYWFDELKLGDDVMHGKYNDIELWQLKKHKNIFVLFSISHAYVKYFVEKYYQITGIGLKYVKIDFSKDIHAETFHHITTINDDITVAKDVYNDNQLSNRDILEKQKNIVKIGYQIDIQGKNQFLELFFDGLVKFGIEKDDKVVEKIVDYALLFRKSELVK